MITRILCLLLVVSSHSVYANLDQHFQTSEHFANVQNNRLSQTIQHLNPQHVPGFKTRTPREIHYRNANIHRMAQQRASDSPTGRFIIHNDHYRQHDRINQHDRLITHANHIVTQSQAITQHSGAFCAQGHCATMRYQPSRDLKQTIAVLSAVDAGGHDLTQQVDHYAIFTGDQQRCRLYRMGFSNCCADRGWGQDIGLAKCKASEKKLGHDKQAGVCHYVGKYCSKMFRYVFGKTCREYSKRYCCFHSKLARLVQDAGHAQLRLGWGSGKHPDCRGLTPQELQRIDFSRINLSPVYQDILRRVHHPMRSRIQTRITHEVQHAINHEATQP